MQICVTHESMTLVQSVALNSVSPLIVMNTPNSCVFMVPKAQVHWSEADTNILIDFFMLQLPTVADGTGFKSTVWTEAAMKVNALAKTQGCDKTGPSCKNKFARVRVQSYSPTSFLIDLFQLKETYSIIVKIKAQSGFKWDDKKGVDIDESTMAIWEAFKMVCDHILAGY